MAVQTAIDQPLAQPKLEEQTPPDQRATGSLIQPQQGIYPTNPLTTGEAETAHPARAVDGVSRVTIVFATATTLTAAAFFGYGLASSRALPALRRLVISAEDIRVPILLPVTLAEIAWELFTERRAVLSAANRDPAR